MLRRRQPEHGKSDPARSGWRGLHILLHVIPANELPAHLAPARAWLEANLGTERLAYCELAPRKRFGRHQPISLAVEAEKQRIELENDAQMNPLHRERLLDLVWPITLAKVYGHVDLVRVQHRVYWERDDPIQMLAPGIKYTYTTKALAGISHARVAEVSSTMGLTVGKDPFGLNGQLSEKVSSSFALTSQHEVSKQLELANDRQGFSRRIAIWRYVHVLRFEYLTQDRPKVQYPTCDTAAKQWNLLTELSSVDEAQPVTTTYVDVQIADA